MDHGTRNFFTRVELAAYGLMVAIVAVGFYLAIRDESLFRSFYVPEDGVLESGTAVVMAIASVLALVRFFQGRRQQRWTSSAFFLGCAVLFCFVAGEEISWGQRIFNVESSEFFLNNNRQNETNLHNLAVGGVNLNKLFAKVLTLFLILFYLVLPITYARGNFVHRLVAPFGIPVPKIHNGIALIILGIAIDQIPSPKRGELNEVVLCLFVLLLLTFAQNIRHTRRDGSA